MAIKLRKRGVKASREKLDAAMLNAGIKTQSSLAEHIAANENLELAPKDTINRAFRQENVSPTTIARIAKVLKVEAFTLYLSKQEDELLKSNELLMSDSSAQSLPPLLKLPSNFYKQLLLVFSIIALIFLFWQYQPGSSILSTSPPSIPKPPLGHYSLVLYSYSPATDRIIQSLRDAIDKKFKVININRTLLPNNTMSVDIAREYQADGVLTVRNIKTGRFYGIQIYLYFDGIEKLLWADSFSHLEIAQRNDEIVGLFMPFLKREFGPPVPTNQTKKSYSSLASQKKYLQARKFLDGYQSELRLKSAQELLHSAIKASPNFAKAHAALCKSYIYESWRSDEKEYLEEAQTECDIAIDISPHELYVNATMAHLFRRSGRIKDSIGLYHKLLEIWPGNVDVLSGLSNAYGHAFKQGLSEFPNAKTEMIKYVRRSTEIEPDFWRHHQTLGLVNHYAGDRAKAAVAFGKSVQLNPNELAFINVGVVNQCLGNLDLAESFFKDAQKVAPESYLGDDYLGSVYFYKKEFQKSYQIKKKALDTFNDTETGGIHQMWGDLGDAYRHAGQIEKASRSYLAALKIIERDELRGNITVDDKVNRYYYHLILTRIAPERYSAKTFKLDSSRLKILFANKSNTAYARTALCFYLQEEMGLAKQALKKAILKCPVYKTHPDLKAILKNQT